MGGPPMWAVGIIPNEEDPEDWVELESFPLQEEEQSMEREASFLTKMQPLFCQSGVGLLFHPFLMELAHGLKELLSYEGNVEEDFYSTFQLLRPEEVEILVCGSPELDMHALQRSTQYDGYAKTDLTIRYFWDVVLGFPLDLQKKLLHFTTGSDRVPVGGMADLNFKISKNETSTNW
ncbi:hypothetical protein U0070_008680 [Myodes glareolus]|uniref:HECT-type E3 ubiquitin transferase n=1 Tax=Myodes glareolus TaxID=447135 RepID=A0AAW0IB41_MYOGA